MPLQHSERKRAPLARAGRVAVGLLATTLVLGACSGDSGDVDLTGTVEETPATTTDPESGDTTDTDDPPAATTPQEVQLTSVAQGESLTAMAAHPASGDLFLAERAGQVVRVEPSGGLSGPLIDISGEVTDGFESGLLGLAFSPDGDLIYLSYSDPDNATTVVEFGFTDGSVDAADRRLIFRQEQPFENHNGGDIAFGPDGYLYVGLGDGGAGGDPLGSGQDTSTTLGSILRIDPLSCVDGACNDVPYLAPADNPFIGGGGVPEIWAYGVRNPWRFSFDMETDDLWVGDVGQNSVEEVTYLPGPDAGRGANLGWNEMEGSIPFDEGTPPAGHVGPIVEYANDRAVGGDNCSVTGGYVYRGSEIPFLDGVYLYGDFCAGDILGLRQSAGEAREQLDLGLSAGADQLASFGQDADGEVYVLTLGGTLYRIDPA